MVLSAIPRPPAAVLAAWRLEDCAAEPVAAGLINATYLCREPGGQVRAVLQRLHPIFAAEVNVDIDAVTTHLAGKGLPTPRLIATAAGERWTTHDGAVWRALTYVDGVTLHEMPDAAHAATAGELVGRFHRALADLGHRFVFERPGAHDTAAHLARLAAALDGAGARDAIEVDAVNAGRRILQASAGLSSIAGLPRRALHGDLKVSNVRFAAGTAAPRAACLIDLDTVGMQTIAYEMGDALRSWCNPRGEDTAGTRFDLALFAASLSGYAAGAGDLLSADEIAAILPGLETVCLELAARFCADVFEDRYFGWDPTRFASRREHNLVRARGQLGLAAGIAAARGEATEAVFAAFGRR